MSSTEAAIESNQQSLLVKQASLLLRIEKLRIENSHSTSTRLDLENVEAAIEYFISKIDNNNYWIKISLYRLLITTIRQIAEVKRLIYSGEYFSSLDQVWTSQQSAFMNSVVSLFDRPYSVLKTLEDNGMSYYKNTVDVDENDMELVDDQSESSQSSRSLTSELGSNGVDIFGVATFAHSAHLMPASSVDAAKWHLIVPGVLSRNVQDMNYNKMKMFIHGFRKRHREENSKKMKRIKYAGIQHFPTNTIRLLRKDEFFDTNHCLLIIPILSREEIINWDGVVYEAIVLADHLPGTSDTSSMIYLTIGATTGAEMRPNKDILAKTEEIELCRLLLEQLILVVDKSFVDFQKTDEGKTADTLTSRKTSLKERLTVPTPYCLSDSSPRRVRKIRFIDFHQNNNNEDLHRAPDPMLLLSKAVSNWLHIHKLVEILPSIENDTTSETTSIRSYDSEEENHRVVCNLTREPNHPLVGQRPEFVDNPPFTEIAFINNEELSISNSSD